MFSWFGKEKTEKTQREKYLAEQEALATPWANFEVTDVEKTGQIKVVFHWNEAFIEKMKMLGIEAETPDEVVQLFFMLAARNPNPLDVDGDDGVVEPSEHPNLSSDTHTLRR